MLSHHHNRLRLHGFVNGKDFYNIVKHGAKFKNLDKAMFHSYGEIGRLNSTKIQLEKDVEEFGEKDKPL
jgi:hypothetical protein